MEYSKDREISFKNGYKFNVVTKQGQGQKWETVEESIEDLHHAMELAKSIECYEVGIFVRDGFKYWSSRHPDLLNSKVITMKIVNYPGR